MAALGPTNLQAMVVNMSGADAHESSVRHEGALELRFLAWAFWHSAANTQRALKADPAVDAALNLGAPTFADWLTRMPIRKGQTQLKLVPPYQKWALDLLTKADYDEYWQHPSYAPALFWDEFPGRADSDHRGLVRFVHALDVQKLRRVVGAQAGAGADAHGAVDARDANAWSRALPATRSSARPRR